MNQDTTKERLISLGAPEQDFMVLFSGKESKKVNGLYRPDTKEIIIHNKNFTNDNALMFTAIHEYAHHIVVSRKLVKGRSHHPNIFWAIFHSLLKIAIEKEIYTDVFDETPELVAVDSKIEKLVQEQVEVQRKLGSALLEMQTVCHAKGARFEDYLDRKARIPKSTAKAAITAQLELFELEGASQSVVEVIASIKEEGRRDEAVARVEEGQTIAQVKAAVKQGHDINPLHPAVEREYSPEDRLDRLVSDRKKLNGKIQALELKLQELDAEIEDLRSTLPHLEFNNAEDGDYIEVDALVSEAVNA